MKKPAKFAVSLLLLAALGAGNMVAFNYSTIITSVLCGTGENFSNAQEALQESDKLCRKVGEESIVLLKNEDENGKPVLPLKNEVKQVNIFGWGATDAGFLQTGWGSGSTAVNPTKAVTLLDAFNQEGVDLKYNPTIIDFYNNFGSKNSGSLRTNPVDKSEVYKLNEPSVTELEPYIADAQDFSDVAIFVISRCGGENIGDLGKPTDPSKEDGYLNISGKEQATLDLLKDSFETVIVLLNTTNTMHTGFLEDEGIDAAMYVGITGQSAAAAIPKILTGEVTPSGKLADTMTYFDQYDPTYANITQSGGTAYQYVEDIYFGYKWYETADVEHYFDGVSNNYGEGYDGVVQYPFGHGLSYTEFEWEVDSDALYTMDGENKKEIDFKNDVVLDDFDVDTKIYLDVTVNNVGDYNGKDVVELFYTPEYTGDIEKAEVNLLDFAKTPELESEGLSSGTVTLSFTPYDLASYDAKAIKADNGGYVIEKGEYTIKLMTDSHNMKDCENDEITFIAKDDIIIKEDPVTGETVENRFTGEGAYMGLDIDALKYGATPYMTRADFEKTFPKKANSLSGVPSVDSKYYDEPYENLPAVVTGEDNGLYLAMLDDGSKATQNQLEGKDGSAKLVWDYELLEELMDYDSKMWDDLLNQMTPSEMKSFIEIGGFFRAAVESVGKPRQYDYDGPAGFNTNSRTGKWGGEAVDTETWTAFPSEALMGCSWNKDLMFELGRSMGAEAADTNVDGWYAPGVNLHRNAYLGRNFEYYSEDGVLSGKLAAKVVYGAKTNGLTCYVKHFVSSDGGGNPRNADTWMTEQNLRENVLRPFEITVKEGGANGMMSAFNNLGTIWCGANYALLTEVLRGEWGFRGTVITDYMTSSTDGLMSVRQGIRAGNDLMLNPQDNMGGSVINPNDEIDMKAARIACKNLLYTTVDTEYTAYQYRNMDINDIYQTSGTIGFKEEVFAWWIPALYVLDAAIALGLLIWTFKGDKNAKGKNKKNGKKSKNSKYSKKGGKKRRA